MSIKLKILLAVLIYTASLSANGAASVPSYSYTEMYMYDNQDGERLLQDTDEVLIADPLEPINRHIFNINSLLDSAFLAPVAETYIAITPKHVKTSIGNFMNNIGEPINFINLMFQGNFNQARITFGRFITNSLLGFFGIMDVAGACNMPYKGEDFGQTLAYHQVPTGPYLVMPVFGPSSTRDSAGKVVDFFADPFRYALDRKERDIINITWLLHKRAESNSVIKSVKRSLDPYETAKMLYIQNRVNQIKNSN